MEPGKIHIGTSGWHYRHWLGNFYPAGTPPHEWFSIYASRFATVELNNSFYQLPSEETFTGWAKAAPPGFLFSVKGSRFITHIKKLRESKDAFDLFHEHARKLDGKLGPVLFQLPPHWHYDGARLEEFLAGLPRKTRYAFEFRDPSWENPEAFALLAKHHAAFVIHDMGQRHTPEQVTADFVYVRFHGMEAKYGGAYSDDTLKEWAGKVFAWSQAGRQVFCYFNNDSGGWAPRNAATLISLLKA